MDFKNLVDGMTIVNVEDETDILKAKLYDYYSTGEKIMCLINENSIYPADEICEEYYKPLNN